MTGLAAWLLATFAAAAVGALGSRQAAAFYALLERPEWAPPAWLFGPAWTVLYALMAIAAWRLWRRAGFAGAPLALGLFLAQLALNALWSWLFFTWRLGAAAFVEIVVLWALVGATTLAFARHDTLSAVLLVPYFVWVSYAAALCWAIWRANPRLLGC